MLQVLPSFGNGVMQDYDMVLIGFPQSAIPCLGIKVGIENKWENIE
jgi:hypothetical protein